MFGLKFSKQAILAKSPSIVCLAKMVDLKYFTTFKVAKIASYYVQSYLFLHVFSGVDDGAGTVCCIYIHSRAE